MTDPTQPPPPPSSVGSPEASSATDDRPPPLNTLAELERFRLAALNMMEDAAETQRRLKQANEDLARAVAEKDRLVAAIEQSWDAVVVTDVDANIQYVNQTFERVTGYTRDELVGKNPRVLQSGRQDAAFYREMWERLSNGNPFFGRMVNKRKDGQLFTEDASISPVKNAEGRIVNFVGVKRDITERLKMEDRLAHSQKMETVGRLAGGVAHDFNNMLSVILGNAELLKEGLPADSVLHEEVAAIINAAKRSSEITRQLLAFARKQIVKPQLLDLNEAIESCLKLLRRLIGENIELVWKPHPAPCRIKIDPVQVDQVLTNLCVNARDAIPDVGTITIETSLTTCSADVCALHEGCSPGEFVLLTVSDTGEGMTPEVMAHAFEPFFSTKSLGEGTGLGLATVHGIVTQNGGFVVAESRLGAGAAFRLHFPHQRQSDEAPSRAAPAVEPRGRGQTVLIVEDETMLLQLGATMLRSLGYRVLAADGPEVALACVQNHPGPIDLLLTDVVMSGMNGKELADRIRAIHPAMSVLFMSGYTAEVIASRGVLDRDVHFISKPFTRYDLAVHLARCFAAAWNRDAAAQLR